MCGIWALFANDDGSSVDASTELSETQWRSCHTIAHRGPDAWRVEGLRKVKGCCLGFHRLSIVDDLLGMQPMRLFSLPHIWSMYNGEIYNHKLLVETHGLQVITGCDGEPIIHLYNSQGPQAMAAQLDGVFAACLVDTSSRKVILARDTFGVRPLFTCHAPDSGFLLGVCSEAKGLTDLAKSVTGAKIEPFPPGHVAVYDLNPQGNAVLGSLSRFHTIGQPPAYKTLASPNDDEKKSIRTLLEAAVRKRLMGERTIGCLLSGGLDSSLVAGLTVSLSKEMGINSPVHTFSVGMAGSPDILAARKVAEHLKTKHHEVIFTPEEALDAIPDVIHHLESYDITTVRASVGMYLISRYIRQETDVAVLMSGEGADEVAQGYIYFQKAPSASEGDAESRRILQDLYYFDVLRADRTTAAWGLEVRVPFLDHQFTGYYLSLPAESRQPRDGVEKALLREAFGDTQLIPEDILWRPKEAFSDGLSSIKKSWFQIVQGFCELEVSNEELKAAKVAYPHNTPETKEALYYRKLFEAHFSEPHNASWIPYFWLPRWADSKDPSARTLDYYRITDSE